MSPQLTPQQANTPLGQLTIGQLVDLLSGGGLGLLLNGLGVPNNQIINQGNVTRGQLHPNASAIERLHHFFDDPFGRLDAVPLIKATAGAPILVMTNAGQDYTIQPPDGAKAIVFEAMMATAPDNSGNFSQTWAPSPIAPIETSFFYSTGYKFPPLNPNGLAYDGSQALNAGASGTDSRNGYTGIAFRPWQAYTIALNPESGPMHFASQLGGSQILAGFFG